MCISSLFHSHLSFPFEQLGALFVCSCIPSSSAGPSISSDFFDRPSRSPASVHSVTETNIWTASQALMERVYKIFYTLLKAGQNVQDLTRTWIGQVLTRNRVRGQTWHSHQQHLAVLNRSTCVSDGFMLNLVTSFRSFERVESQPHNFFLHKERRLVATLSSVLLSDGRQGC